MIHNLILFSIGLFCVILSFLLFLQQDIVAQPDFTVEIAKSSSECLTFECYFPDDDLNEEGGLLAIFLVAS